MVGSGHDLIANKVCICIESRLDTESDESKLC